MVKLVVYVDDQGVLASSARARVSPRAAFKRREMFGSVFQIHG